MTPMAGPFTSFRSGKILLKVKARAVYSLLYSANSRTGRTATHFSEECLPSPFGLGRASSSADDYERQQSRDRRCNQRRSSLPGRKLSGRDGEEASRLSHLSSDTELVRHRLSWMARRCVRTALNPGGERCLRTATFHGNADGCAKVAHRFGHLPETESRVRCFLCRCAKLERTSDRDTATTSPFGLNQPLAQQT